MCSPCLKLFHLLWQKLKWELYLLGSTTCWSPISVRNLCRTARSKHGVTRYIIMAISEKVIRHMMRSTLHATKMPYEVAKKSHLQIYLIFFSHLNFCHNRENYIYSGSCACFLQSLFSPPGHYSHRWFMFFPDKYQFVVWKTRG